jgi:hypothetical protein
MRDLERVAGIEPAYSAWKAAALPLSYTRFSATAALPDQRWWRRLDSNQRRLSQRIYSPSPLTTRTLLQFAESVHCPHICARAPGSRQILKHDPRRVMPLRLDRVNTPSAIGQTILAAGAGGKRIVTHIALARPQNAG